MSVWMEEGTYLSQIDTLAVLDDDADPEDSGDGILPGLSSIDSVETERMVAAPARRRAHDARRVAVLLVTSP